LEVPWNWCSELQIGLFLCSVRLTLQKKKKPRVKISWKQEGNKKVGVKVNAEESMYVCSRRDCRTVQNSNMKELANESFENMSVSHMFGNRSNKPKLKSLRSYNHTEFGDFFIMFGFLVTSRNKDRVLKLISPGFLCMGVKLAVMY
jgi:hypothetical protein